MLERISPASVTAATSRRALANAARRAIVMPRRRWRLRQRRAEPEAPHSKWCGLVPGICARCDAGVPDWRTTREPRPLRSPTRAINREDRRLLRRVQPDAED